MRRGLPPDIPLLGLLFQSEFEDSRKIELLIVLTPHVITSPADFARIDELTHREIGRMSLSPEEKKGLEKSFLIPEQRTWKERIKEDMRRKWGRTPTDENGADEVDGQTEPEQPEASPPLTTYEADLEREDDR